VTDAILERELLAAGLSFSTAIREKLALYIRELEYWNRKVNLTSLQGAELVRRLVVEPAWIGQQLQMSGKLADIGSGNGSPGIPLFLACNLSGVHLIEVRARRAAFLRHLATQLDPGRVNVHKARVEDLSELEPVEWITLQAVRPSGSLVEALCRLCPSTTHVVWITASQRAPSRGALRVAVPWSGSEAWVFRLDQF
jgi:16S rRNA (guanine527-N7)-methyltransferase